MLFDAHVGHDLHPRVVVREQQYTRLSPEHHHAVAFLT